LREFHLKFAFPGVRAPRENIQNELGPVNDLTASLFFQVSLLSGREFVIENQKVQRASGNAPVQLFSLPAADKKRWIGVRTLLQDSFQNPGARSLSQGFEFDK